MPAMTVMGDADDLLKQYASGAVDAQKSARVDKIRYLINNAKFSRAVTVYDTARFAAAGLPTTYPFFGEGKGKGSDAFIPADKKQFRSTTFVNDGLLNEGEILILMGMFKAYPFTFTAAAAPDRANLQKTIEFVEAGIGGAYPHLVITLGQDNVFTRFNLHHVPSWWTFSAAGSFEAANLLSFGESGALMLDSRTKLMVEAQFTTSGVPIPFGLDFIMQLGFVGLYLKPLNYEGEAKQIIESLSGEPGIGQKG